MTDKELKKLTRAELLELLLIQTQRADVLEEELSKAKDELQNKEIKIENAGSIAGAAVQLSGIFEKAEVAAGEYLENIKMLSDHQEEVCAKLISESKKRAEKIISDAEAESEKKKQAADAYCKAVTQKIQMMLSGVRGIKGNVKDIADLDSDK